MIARVWSDELSLQLESTNEFRKILSSSKFHLYYFFTFLDLFWVILIKLLQWSRVFDQICVCQCSFNCFFKFRALIIYTDMAHPIENVVGSGAEPRFVEFLGKEVIPKFQVIRRKLWNRLIFMVFDSDIHWCFCRMRQLGFYQTLLLRNWRL